MTLSHQLNKLAIGVLLATSLNANDALAMNKDTIRVATFNVSMEALNYLPRAERGQNIPKGSELQQALGSDHQQIKNIAEIIQTVQPDVLLLNEFDRIDGKGNELARFVSDYLNKSQNGQPAIDYLYSFQGPVNTGVLANIDINGDGKISHPADTYGFGYFAGHFGMAVLSKFPIDNKHIRSFQNFKWSDMPKALKPMNKDGSSYYADTVWQELRLSSKSHWDIPIQVGKNSFNLLASHPTPPVFDGEEDRNGKRNHDEIRFWVDYISQSNNGYIYDDKNVNGGLKANTPFVILGDLNASVDDGDANTAGIGALLNHDNINDVKPASKGGELHKTDNVNGKYHTAYWGMRADYVLPSQSGWKVVDAGVYWPTKESRDFRLIKDRAASSDHRMVWVDLQFVE